MTASNKSNIIRFPIERTLRVTEKKVQEKWKPKHYSIADLVNMYIDDTASYRDIMEYAEEYFDDTDLEKLKAALGECVDLLR